MSVMFPNRPKHPDFHKLAAIVRRMDADADEHMNATFVLSPIIDMATVVYVAEQRVLRAQIAARTSDMDRRVQAISIWMDGFAAGARWQQGKGS